MDNSFRNYFMILFGVVFSGFAFFWMYMAFSLGAPFPVPLFGLIFVVAGFAVIAAGFRAIIKGPTVREEPVPPTYEEYMKAQEEAKKKENEDPNASSLSTEDRH